MLENLEHLENLEKNRQLILKQINQIAQENHINAQEIQLIAVSKTFPADNIRTLYQFGQRQFGENYIQEFQEKSLLLKDLDKIEWHIIGHIQSNKSKIVAEQAHWVHTIDRIKLAQRLNQQRPDSLLPLNVCIEINISGEENKHGIIPDKNILLELAQEIILLEKLNLRGLMCVAKNHSSDSELTQQFTQMQDLLKNLQTIVPQANILSMGMSGDLEMAIKYGANMVRIGSAIFGKRDYS